MTDAWKLFDHLGLLPPANNTRISVEMFVNMFAKKFFSKPGAKQCKLKTFGTKENPEIVGEDGVVRKKYKTQQHEIHKCYICKEQRKAPTDKI